MAKAMLGYYGVGINWDEEKEWFRGLVKVLERGPETPLAPSKAAHELWPHHEP